MSPVPLFIGRFQPFHLGHLDAVQQILTSHGSVIIGIGSSQYEDLPKNPYSAEMRKQMIVESLTQAGITESAYRIALIPDIHDDERWVEHAEKCVGEFGEIYSGTAKVQKLFKKSGRHTVRSPRFNLKISGTAIREKIARCEPWEALVPKAAASIIKLWK